MEKENKAKTREEHEETLTDPYYQKEAKRFVDMMFDNGLFNPQLSRDDFQAVENLMAFYLDINTKMARKATEIMLRIKKD